MAKKQLGYMRMLCWLFKKSKTLWNPILAHTIYDLTYVFLVGGN